MGNEDIMAYEKGKCEDDRNGDGNAQSLPSETAQLKPRPPHHRD